MSQTLFTIIGYFAFTLYTVLIVVVGEVLGKVTKLDKTVCRKITHLASAFLWVICWYFFGCSIHWVILNGISTVLLAVIIFGNFLKSFDREDCDKSYGIFYFSLSTFIVATICYLVGAELYLYTGITYYCLAFGDGFAPLVAKALKKYNVTIKKGKTLFGTLSVFIVSFLVVLIFSLTFQMNLSVPFILSVASLTCVTEFYGYKGTDNLLIEFAVFLYLVLYHYGLIGLPLQIVLISSPVLACLAIGFKTMTDGAGVLSLILFLAVGFFGNNFVTITFIVALFLIITLTALITKKCLAKNTVNSEKQQRKAKQIIAVGVFATISIIIFYVTGILLFYYLYFLALTEQFADSMASDIGKYTNGKNVDIITFKSVEKGLSGGVSLLGTLCALFFGFLIMLIPLIWNILSIKYFIIIGLLSFLGTLIDSVLGSRLQALYKCSVCGKLLEDNSHCGEKALIVKGVGFIDNSTVNIFTGFITCLLGVLLLLVF